MSVGLLVILGLLAGVVGYVVTRAAGRWQARRLAASLENLRATYADEGRALSDLHGVMLEVKDTVENATADMARAASRLPQRTDEG